MPETLSLFITLAVLLVLITIIIVMVAIGAFHLTNSLFKPASNELSSKAFYESLTYKKNYEIVCDSVTKSIYGATYYATINDYYVNFEDTHNDSLVVNKHPKIITSANLSYLIAYLKLTTGCTFTAINSDTGEEIDLKKL